MSSESWIKSRYSCISRVQDKWTRVELGSFSGFGERALRGGECTRASRVITADGIRGPLLCCCPSAEEKRGGKVCAALLGGESGRPALKFPI